MPGNVLRKCIKPIFDAYTLPSNLQTSVIHQHYTQEVFKFEWVWFIELNRTEHFCYKPFFNGLLGLQCNLQSLIVPLGVLAGLCVPGCHSDWVVWSILIWLLVMSSTTVNILCPLFPREKEGLDFQFLSVLCPTFTSAPSSQPRSFCHDPEPVLHIRFSVLFPDVCRCLG